MSTVAPVLSTFEQKRSLSWKKKKVVKNILGLPNSLKVESRVVGESEGQKLCKVLERLLPLARLPIRSKSKEAPEVDPQEVEKARNKRVQLSIGVNSVNRCIQKDLISAVIMASDIQPRFLIHHLNLLCNHKKIPFIHLQGLREVSNNCLGFPCIVLGFRKDSSDFSEAIQEIKSLSDNVKACGVNEKGSKMKQEEDEDEGDEEVEVGDDEDDIDSGNDSDSVDNDGDDDDDDDDERKKTPFTYLYRTSNKMRIFNPESNSQPKKDDSDFIPLLDDNETDLEKQNQEKLKESKLGISSNTTRKMKKKKTELMTSQEVYSTKMKDSEELEYIPNKKPKKDWVFDTKGDKHKFRYSSANVHKFHSNPNRLKRKNK